MKERTFISFDWAIKKVLRHKENFTVLEGFLSELLGFDIKIENILESESNKQHEADKFDRVDILVKSMQGELMLIEVQYDDEIDYFHRMVYGISKLAGERWCEYYHNRFNVDVRSIRYPGLISYSTLPGGGTTDYAVDIFYHAKKNGNYKSFLKSDTALPMMYMKDAVRATIELMHADKESVKIRSSYNLAGISFTPEQLASAIKLKIANFEINSWLLAGLSI